MSVTRTFIMNRMCLKACIVIKKLFSYNIWVKIRFFLNNKINRKWNFFSGERGGDTIHGGTMARNIW